MSAALHRHSFKHADWRDEREWRLILFTDMEQSTSDRIVPFERTAISRIFIGPRITPDDKAAIWNAATARPPHIPVYERVIDPVVAREEMLGYEEIKDVRQLEYWFPHLRGSFG